VRSDGVAIERRELIANRDALIELAELRRAQQNLQIQLADQDDLEQLLFVGFEIRQNANLLEHRQREMLRFVDDEDRARLERNQREQKIVERVDELRLGDAREPSLFHLLAGHHAEVLQDSLEQILLGKKRIEDERREGGAVDFFEQRAAQRRLAGADVAGH